MNHDMYKRAFVELIQAYKQIFKSITTTGLSNESTELIILFSITCIIVFYAIIGLFSEIHTAKSELQRPKDGYSVCNFDRYKIIADYVEHNLTSFMSKVGVAIIYSANCINETIVPISGKCNTQEGETFALAMMKHSASLIHIVDAQFGELSFTERTQNVRDKDNVCYKPHKFDYIDLKYANYQREIEMGARNPMISNYWYDELTNNQACAIYLINEKISLSPEFKAFMDDVNKDRLRLVVKTYSLDEKAFQKVGGKRKKDFVYNNPSIDAAYESALTEVDAWYAEHGNALTEDQIIDCVNRSTLSYSNYDMYEYAR